MGEGERVDQRPFLSFLFCLLFLGFEDSLLLSLFLVSFERFFSIQVSALSKPGIRIPERILNVLASDFGSERSGFSCLILIFRISKSQGLLPDFPFFSKILFKFKLKHSNFSSESAFLFFFPPDRKVASIL
ncbi:hypothetical protein F8388_006685 [Cannabis sativa]|uniref:Uncharacterized protein n=1 Tax=Cannabis sativa TaxID=3483 RepID=A0A7J6GWK5_CANSA|nr:hypothetical protein F8388_006685 [Cannabis sativa]